MLGLAISIDTDRKGTSIIETNDGLKFESEEWPQDSEFQLMAFNQSKKTCEIIRPEQLAEDIAMAVVTLKNAGVLKDPKPDWYIRLAGYATN